MTTVGACASADGNGVAAVLATGSSPAWAASPLECGTQVPSQLVKRAAGRIGQHADHHIGAGREAVQFVAQQVAQAPTNRVADDR